MKTAVIFDLDGVIVSTDEFHYRAWKIIADEEGIPFDHEANNALRGVSRMESLEIILTRSSKVYNNDEKIKMSEKKNSHYLVFLESLTPNDILPGVKPLLQSLKDMKIPIAIGSSSKNANPILKKIGLEDMFDAVVDGNMISNSKPDPEVFNLAAKLLKKVPDECVVIEDAESGIEAAKRANMFAVGIGASVINTNADVLITDLTHLDIKAILDGE